MSLPNKESSIHAPLSCNSEVFTTPFIGITWSTFCDSRGGKSSFHGICKCVSDLAFSHNHVDFSYPFKNSNHFDQTTLPPISQIAGEVDVSNLPIRHSYVIHRSLCGLVMAELLLPSFRVLAYDATTHLPRVKRIMVLEGTLE